MSAITDAGKTENVFREKKNKHESPLSRYLHFVSDLGPSTVLSNLFSISRPPAPPSAPKSVKNALCGELAWYEILYCDLRLEIN